jgi:hypothetical protein
MPTAKTLYLPFRFVVEMHMPERQEWEEKWEAVSPL